MVAAKEMIWVVTMMWMMMLIRIGSAVKRVGIVTIAVTRSYVQDNGLVCVSDRVQKGGTYNNRQISVDCELSIDFFKVPDAQENIIRDKEGDSQNDQDNGDPGDDLQWSLEERVCCCWLDNWIAITVVMSFFDAGVIAISGGIRHYCEVFLFVLLDLLFGLFLELC